MAFNPLTDCSDCGNAPKHPMSPCGYCRRCSEKGGYRWDFLLVVDRDLVIRYFGEGMLQRLEQDAKPEYCPPKG